jgi:hypothetical protein
MKPEDYDNMSDFEAADEVTPNAEPHIEFFDNSSNKCDIDTAEAHDTVEAEAHEHISNSELLKQFESHSHKEKKANPVEKHTPLKRYNTAKFHA